MKVNKINRVIKITSRQYSHYMSQLGITFSPGPRFHNFSSSVVVLYTNPLLCCVLHASVNL